MERRKRGIQGATRLRNGGKKRFKEVFGAISRQE